MSSGKQPLGHRANAQLSPELFPPLDDMARVNSKATIAAAEGYATACPSG